MADFDVDAVVESLAAQIRKAIADAEARAREIIRAAEKEAEGIRGRAEAEARDQVEGARRALEELTAKFGSGAAAVSAPPAPEPPPPAPNPPAPEPVAPAAAEPEPPPAPEPTATATQSSSGDSQAARLVAMKMALDGASREAIEAELERSYSLTDRGALLDEVLARVRK